MGKKLISYPYEDRQGCGLLSYYVFYQDKLRNSVCGTTGRPVKHMTGVTLANKAKAEIYKLRQ